MFFLYFLRKCFYLLTICLLSLILVLKTIHRLFILKIKFILNKNKRIIKNLEEPRTKNEERRMKEKEEDIEEQKEREIVSSHLVSAQLLPARRLPARPPVPGTAWSCTGGIQINRSALNQPE